MVFPALACVSVLLLVFHCTSLSSRVKLGSGKTMWGTLNCVFLLGWRRIIGVCGAPTCVFLTRGFLSLFFSPHVVGKELAFVQQLWSRCHPQCTEIPSSVTDAQRLLRLRALHPLGGCRGLKGIEGTSGINPEHLDVGITPRMAQ